MRRAKDHDVCKATIIMSKDHDMCEELGRPNLTIDQPIKTWLCLLLRPTGAKVETAALPAFQCAQCSLATITACSTGGFG